MKTHILYLAHDLADAAIRRRVMMMISGGARVAVAGFQRAENLLQNHPEVKTITLGRTEDARFVQRIGAVASVAMSLKSKLGAIQAPDVIVARNVEMLALAARASKIFGGDVPIVYECLDIHRLLLDDGMKGRLLRAAEGYFGRRAKLLITSSPAFVENYFGPRSKLDVPTLLVENKVLDLSDPAPTSAQSRIPTTGKPWRIGWFGALRCRKSLAMLSEFSRRMEGSVEIVLRGRPARSEFENFEREVEEAPFVQFRGAYRNPEDLASIYDDVHFVWAIDFFEEGLNSEWLLPNRLYEGSLYGGIPIALKSTETGRFLDERSLGLTLDLASPEALTMAFGEMTPARYHALLSRMEATDRSNWVAGPADCHDLVARLSKLGGLRDGVSAPSAGSMVSVGR